MSIKKRLRSGKQNNQKCKCGNIINYVSTVYAFGTDSNMPINSISVCKKCKRKIVEIKNQSIIV